MKRPSLLSIAALCLACLSCAIVHACGGYLANPWWETPATSRPPAVGAHERTSAPLARRGQPVRQPRRLGHVAGSAQR